MTVRMQFKWVITHSAGAQSIAEISSDSSSAKPLLGIVMHYHAGWRQTKEHNQDCLHSTATSEGERGRATENGWVQFAWISNG